MEISTNNPVSFAQHSPTPYAKTAAITTAIIGAVTAVASAILCASNAGWISLGTAASVFTSLPPVLPIALCTLGVTAVIISIIYLCVKQTAVRKNKSVVTPPLKHDFESKSKKFEPSDLSKLTDAASGGNAEDQYKLGLHFMQDSHEKDTKVGLMWLELAAAQNHLEAKREVGQFYFEEAKNNILTKGAFVDEKEIADLYKLAAINGHAEAQYEFALCCEAGKGVEQDKNEMMNWLWEASAQGFTLAEFQLGIHYVLLDTPKDKKAGMDLLKKAAKKGYAAAQYTYGGGLQMGVGGEVDNKAGFKWIEKAANQGSAEAIALLGTCYYKGNGCEININKALELFKQAAVKGSPTAKNNIKHFFPHIDI